MVSMPGARACDVLGAAGLLRNGGEKILPGDQDEGGKHDRINDIVLVVHRKTPFPPSTATIGDANRSRQFCAYIYGFSELQVCRRIVPQAVCTSGAR
jgi:hypothetical protein